MTTKRRRKKTTATLVTELDMTDPDGFGRWVARHIEWMRVLNYSEATVHTREPWLVAFAAWCAVRGIMRPREVTKPILERYRRQLYFHRKTNGRPLTFGSQRSRLAPLKLFFAWMTRQNALLWNPASELEMPKVEKRLPRALTEAEMENVLSQPNVTDPLGLRDRAILETFYSTGMRRSELLHLKLADFIGEQGTVFIRRGKGKKDRMVPIGERAIVWVNKYLADVRPLLVVNDSEDTLFVSEHGSSFHPEGLSYRVRQHVRAAKIEKYGACHLFRHTMATLMLEGGADVRFIQEMLGHANLETTEVYTRVSIRTLRAVHEATHPGARLHKAPKDPMEMTGASDERVQLLSLLAAEASDEDEEGESLDSATAEDDDDERLSANVGRLPADVGRLKKTRPMPAATKASRSS